MNFSTKSNVVGLILVKLLTGYSHVAVAECPSGWNEFSSSCYYDNGQTGMTFWAALSTCQERGASVVEISSEEENDFITSIYSSRFIWLYCGDHLVEGEYVCGADNHPLVYTSWGLAKPSDIDDFDCVLSRDGVWSDTSCTIPIPVICEKDAEVDLPNASTDPATAQTTWSMLSSVAVTTEHPMTMIWTTEVPIDAPPRTVNGYMRKDTVRAGYCLVGHVIEDMQSASTVRCLGRCMALPSCASMNVFPREGRCELNKSSRTMSSVDFHLIDDCEYFDFLLD